MTIQKDSGLSYTTLNKIRQRVMAVVVVVIMLVSQIIAGFDTSVATTISEPLEAYGHRTEQGESVINHTTFMMGVVRANGTKELTFCREYGVAIPFGYAPEASLEDIDLANTNNKEINDIMYFGFTVLYPDFVAPYNNPAPINETIERTYIYTQYYVWERLKALGFPNSNMFPGTTAVQPAYQEEYNAWKIGMLVRRDKFYAGLTNYTFNSYKADNSLKYSTSGTTFNNTTLSNFETGGYGVATVENAEYYNAVDSTLPNGLRIRHAYGSSEIRVDIPSNFMGTSYRFRDDVLRDLGFRSIYANQGGTGYWVYWGPLPWQRYFKSTPPNDIGIKFDILIDQTGSLDIIKVNDKNGQYDSFPLNDSPTSYTNNDLLAGSWWKLKGTTAAIDGVVELVDKNLEITGGHRQFDNITRGAYTLKEITAPTRYILNPNTITGILINPGQTTTVGALNSSLTTNTEPTGRLTIKKHDIETGADTQGEAVFAGAV